MATAAVLQRPMHGVSTKGLQCDDPIAKLIQEEFVDRVVSPKEMMLYLPHDTLTEADEDRVATVQDSYGRAAAAHFLLSLITQRDNWITRLQQGLHHRNVRLEDLAKRLEELQAQVPMQIDLDDDDDIPMEVDSEPYTPPYDLTPTAKKLLDGSQPKDLDALQLKNYMEYVRAHIEQHFFSEHFARLMDKMEKLTHCLQHLTTAITQQYAIGCLELRLAIATSVELKEFCRLLESGILCKALENVLLGQKQRDWLTAQAALYGLKWRQLRLKITVREYDLRRCAKLLRIQEEKADPRNLAEAYLLRTAARTEEGMSPKSVRELPNLLLSFLDWLLTEYPDLADKVATILVTTSLDTALPKAMYTCRQYFGLVKEFEGDVAKVLAEMLANKKERESSEKTLHLPLAEEESGSRLSAYTALVIETKPGTPMAAIVNRLAQAKLMKPLAVPDTENTFIFSTPFAADFAFSCVADFASRHLPSLSYFPPQHVYEALKEGSPFAILQFLDLILSPSLLEAPSLSKPEDRVDWRFTRNISKRAKRIQEVMIIISKLSEELVQSVAVDDIPVAVVEMLMACYKLFPSRTDIRPIFKRKWVAFGPEWKKMAYDLLVSDKTLPKILLCHLSHQEKLVLLGCVQQAPSLKHTLDLTGKLTEITFSVLEAVLGLAQLSDVDKFELSVSDDGYAVLNYSPESKGDVENSKTTSGHPALKLCQNRMDDEHVNILVKAMPGLQSLPQLDLTGCTMSRQNLQRVLNHLPVESMKMLNISRITLSDASGSKFVPKFSHLKHLQSLDLGSLGLQDEQMSEVAQQLTALHDLRELTLECNPITTAGLSKLTPALASLVSLRVLRLNYCQLDAGAAFVLGAMLDSCPCLQVLNLSNCCLQDSGLQHLSLTMKNHTQLTKVSLRNGGYSPQGLASFLTHLARCSRLQHLEIGQCPLEADGYDISGKLMNTLAVSSLWDFLGLWHCRVGHTSLLQDMLRLENQLHGLTKLVLQDNDLGQASIEHLAQLIRKGIFHYLSHINLRQNNIQALGAECLAEALPFLPHLKELLLQNSSIPFPAAISLARVSLRLPDMKLLELTDSLCMDPQDYVDVAMEIRRIVQEGSEVVGGGVRYPANDQILECSFVQENLCRFNPAGIAHPSGAETKEEEPYLKKIEEHLQSLHKREVLLSIDEGELAKVIETPRFRQIAEQKGDGVVIDGVLHILLGHN